jgi:hypothetical protein
VYSSLANAWSLRKFEFAFVKTSKHSTLILRSRVKNS